MSHPDIQILLATVCLDRNRWGSRVPSFDVSAWLPRFAADGFDGVELWEYHYLRADAAEQARLNAAAPVSVFNTYAGFGDDESDVRTRADAAAAIAALSARRVKYNLGPDAAQRDAYRRNLEAWAGALPPDARLLCECHPGTVLEELDAATAFFEGMDPRRFGVIVHIGADPAAAEPWLRAFVRRVQHIHVQSREPDSDPACREGAARLTAAADLLRAHRFEGSLAVEFTRGIGRDESLETVYAHACADLAGLRAALAR